jgi:hypothetical protein
MKCAYHPSVETNLTCGKCGKPICPREMVQTPVGLRCPDCANLKKLPTYQVSGAYYLRAGGAGLGMALVCGAAWALLATFIHFFLLNIVLGAAVGFAIGEVMSLAVNRKRGTGLAVTGGIAVVISYIIGIIVPWGMYFSFFDILAVAAGVFMAVIRIR